MVDATIKYDCGRMLVMVSATHGSEYLVTACRAGRRFPDRAAIRPEAAVAHCNGAAQAQSLARMLAGVEMTTDGAAIWPDGRTGVEAPEPEPVEHDADCASLIYDRAGRWRCNCGLEAGDRESKPQPERAGPTLVEQARSEVAEGVVVVDDNALVNRADGNPEAGVYVQAWVWVSDEETDR